MDDAAIIAQAKRGDRQAFDSLIDRHHPYLLRLMRLYVGRQEAPDAAQEAWLLVWQKLWQLEENALFRPWLKRLCYYHGINYRKQRTRRRRGEVYLQPDQWRALAATVAAETIDVEALLDRQWFRRVLLESLDRLPGEYGPLLRLHWLKGLRYDQIAVFANLPLGTVKWRMHQAKRLLKALLSVIIEKERGSPRCRN